MIGCFRIAMIAIMFMAIPTFGFSDPTVDKIVQSYKDSCYEEYDNMQAVGDGEAALPATVTLPADAIYELELTPEGTTGTVVYHEFHCAGFGNVWCGTNGCGFHVIVDGKVFERFGGGRPFSVTFEDSTFVIVPLHHGSCSTSDGAYGVGSACYDIVTWDAEKNTFVGQNNRIKVKQVNP